MEKVEGALPVGKVLTRVLPVGKVLTRVHKWARCNKSSARNKVLTRVLPVGKVLTRVLPVGKVETLVSRS